MPSWHDDIGCRDVKGMKKRRKKEKGRKENTPGMRPFLNGY